MSKTRDIPRAAKIIDGRMVVNDFELSSFYFQSIAIRKTRNFSRILKEKHGIGVVEWRLISGLAGQPGSAVSKLSRFTLTDKAQVSKALKSLEKKGIVALVPKKAVRKMASLTDEGYMLHDAFISTVFRRESVIFEGWDEGEVDRFFKMLRRVSENLDKFMEEEI